MRNKLVLGPASRAQDLGCQALSHVAAVTTSLDVDYRLVGGHMVALLVAAYEVTDAPERETADRFDTAIAALEGLSDYDVTFAPTATP